MTSSLHKLVLNSWNNKKHESTTITSSLHKLVLKQQKRSDRTVGIDIICHSVRRRIILTWKFQDRFQVNKHMFNHDECCINLLVWHFTSLVKRIWYQFVGNTSAVITLPSLTFSLPDLHCECCSPNFCNYKNAARVNCLNGLVVLTVSLSSGNLALLPLFFSCKNWLYSLLRSRSFCS